MPLVYPLAIIGLNLLLIDSSRMSTVLLLDFFFLVFYTSSRWIAIMENDYDDYDDNNTYNDSDEEAEGGENPFIVDGNILDLVALFGAIVSAGLISPTGFLFIDAWNDLGLASYVGLSMVFLSSISSVYNLMSQGTIINNDNDDDDDDDDDNINRGDRKGTSNNKKRNDVVQDQFTSDLLQEWDRRFDDL